ncbi:MAG: type I restriction-modification system subunit M N-terminal domain-containing protein [Acidobacteriota bacterium]
MTSNRWELEENRTGGWGTGYATLASSPTRTWRVRFFLRQWILTGTILNESTVCRRCLPRAGRREGPPFGLRPHSTPSRVSSSRRKDKPNSREPKTTRSPAGSTTSHSPGLPHRKGPGSPITSVGIFNCRRWGRIIVVDQARGVLYIPEEARYQRLLELAEGSNIAREITAAMKAVEEENEQLRGVLPKDYNGSEPPKRNHLEG